MLDLSISFLNVDFTVCAKPVLNIHQGLNEFRIRHSARMIAEPVPIFNLFIFFSKVSVETGRRVFSAIEYTSLRLSHFFHQPSPPNFNIRPV